MLLKIPDLPNYKCRRVRFLEQDIVDGNQRTNAILSGTRNPSFIPTVCDRLQNLTQRFSLGYRKGCSGLPWCGKRSCFHRLL